MTYSFLRVFLMWTIFKVLLNLLQCFFCFMFWCSGHKACGILLSSLTRDQTHLTCFVRQCFNPWTTREVPYNLSLVHYIVKSLRARPPLPCTEHQASGSGQKMLLHRPITLFVKVSLDDTFSEGTSHVFSCCKAPGQLARLAVLTSH